MGADDFPGVADWLVPEWPAPAHVRAVFTTRQGGVSGEPWSTLNLGDHVGDLPAAVAANRAILKAAMAAEPVFLRQPHGSDCVDLDVADAAAPPEADGCTVSRPGRACTVLVADCLPVLFTDRAGRRVAAAHAGWRGLAAGVLRNTVSRMRHLLQEPDAPLLAWLGPCIGPDAFEVGDEVLTAFLAGDPGAGACFVPGAAAGKWMANLPGLARRQLAASGVDAAFGNDGAAGWCTVSETSRFFSHRRDAARLGSTGRMAACVWRLG